jgi:hypothetical protein
MWWEFKSVEFDSLKIHITASDVLAILTGVRPKRIQFNFTYEGLTLEMAA